jgi:flagellar protein FliL
VASIRKIHYTPPVINFRMKSLARAPGNPPLKKSGTVMTQPANQKVGAGTEGPKKKGRRGLLLLLAGVPVLLGGGAAAAYFAVPGVRDTVHGLLAHKEPPPPEHPAAPRPVFVDLPEMSVTLPNSGQARQLRIRISLELMRSEPGAQPPDVLTPKVYDALLTYLRTLTDGEVETSLAIDRIRGDLYRRLTLMLGPDVVREVLITALVVA